MSWIPAPVVQPPEGDNRTYVTAALPPDMVARLEQVLDTALRTHPDSDPQGLVDMVMCAGIEAVGGGSYTAIGTACAQRDAYRRALLSVQAECASTADNAANSRRRVLAIVSRALKGTSQ